MNNNNNPLKLYQYSIIQTNTVIKLHQNSSKILKQLQNYDSILLKLYQNFIKITNTIIKLKTNFYAF